MRKLLAASVAAFVLPVSAQAMTVVNGSFEEGIDPGSFTELSAGATNITGWFVDTGSIDYIGSYWQASNGNRSLDLSGGGLGAISQFVDTVAGRSYKLTFDLAGNPDGDPLTKTVAVSATGATAETKTFTVVPGLNTRDNMGWKSYEYTFVATADRTLLSFVSGDNSPYGAALDNVGLTSGVPEPATWALMILGFGAVGGAMRRRRASTLATA